MRKGCENMTYKTDAEIKKAFECCFTDNENCDECPYYCRKENRCTQDGDVYTLPKMIIDLINRQEFKIHQLEKQVSEIQNANLIDFKATIGNYKAENESLKAEVERLKEEKSKFENKIEEIYPLVMQLPNVMQQAKAEAYKECVEAVKKLWGNYSAYEFEKNLDNLLNELVGDASAGKNK